jgi:hypothetical protein
MKCKMLALILALTVMSWAQTATQSAPAATPDKAAPAEMSKCCQKMAKDGASCMRHSEHAANSKEASSCCGGKDAKACCNGKDGKSCTKDDKTAASCCKDGCGKDKTAAACCGDKCGKDGGKDCCSKKDKTAKNCCEHAVQS